MGAYAGLRLEGQPRHGRWLLENPHTGDEQCDI